MGGGAGWTTFEVGATTLTMRLKPAMALILCLLVNTMQASEFPKVWEGTWIGKIGVPTTESTMRLTISPIDSERWNWIIQYSGEPERRYQLKVVDAVNGHYLVDEQNGILIDHFLHGQRLRAAFSINGKLILFEYEMTPDGIRVDSPSFPTANARWSGSHSLPVCSFILSNTQNVLLIKQN